MIDMIYKIRHLFNTLINYKNFDYIFSINKTLQLLTSIVKL